MRIARWRDADGELSEGFVIDGRVVPFPHGATVTDMLARGLAAAQATHGRLACSNQVHDGTAPGIRRLEEVTLLAPVVPAAVRDFVAFEEHVEGVSAGVEGKADVAPEWYEAPTFYFTNPHTILGPADPVRPPVTARLDLELELAAVVGAVHGSDGHNLTPEQAAGHIFGYTVMNDWSARDLQAREMKVRLGPAKGKDFGTTLGPWIVTADEVEAYLDADGFVALRGEVWINDELIGEDLISNMGWPFPVLVAYASRNSRVVPGDVLGSGTIGNGGCLGELWGRNGELSPPPLREGDVVRVLIEGVGELTTTIGAPEQAPPLPRAVPRPRLRRRG